MTDTQPSPISASDDASPLAPVQAEPPEPKRQPLLETAAERHRDLVKLLAKAQEPDGLTDADLVHDLRVCTRRLEEVAALFSEFLEKTTAAAIGESLKSLRRAMGDLRDSDVTCEHLAKWKMPHPIKTLAAEVSEKLAANRNDHTASAAQTITSASVQGAMLMLAQVIEAQCKPDVAEEAEKALEKCVQSKLKKRRRQLKKSFGNAAQKQSPKALHDARIAVKKLRYVAELAEIANLIQGIKTQVKALKQMQQLLGDHHDVHVIAELLNAHLADPREKPIPRLAASWKKWSHSLAAGQAKRAATFLIKSYTWMNA